MDAITFTRDEAGRWHYLCVIYHGADSAAYDDEGAAGFDTIEAAALDLGRSLGVTVDPHADVLVRYGKTIAIIAG